MQLNEREMRRVRGREIALVLQSPLSALNPAMRIGRQLEEAWRAHRVGSKEDCHRAVQESMRSVSLPPDDNLLRRYPSELSVGQAQRVLIAMAIIHRPALLIADEATSALDAVTRTEVLELFRDLNRMLGMAILYVSHDLYSVGALCNRVAILHQGEIVETAAVDQIFEQPRHEYTKLLIGTAAAGSAAWKISQAAR
jgi:ABC-type dipeptide/oligopeptide/nickel transport system ATPase component